MVRTDSLETMLEILSKLGLKLSGMISLDRIGEAPQDSIIHLKIGSGNDNPWYRFNIERQNTSFGTTTYSIADYEVSSLIIPIRHGHFEDIDTQKLEQSMEQIPWFGFPFQSSEVLVAIFDRLDKLRQSPEEGAREVSDRLAVKYFSNTPLEAILNLPDKTRFEKKLLIPIYNNGDDIDMHQAAVLIRGGALLKYDSSSEDVKELCWIKEEKGYIKIYPDFDLSEVLGRMPFVRKPDIIEQSDILASLSKGQPVEGTLLINNRPVAGSISVNPVETTLDFHNSEGRKIPWHLWVKNDQSKKPGKGKKGPGL